MILSKLKISLKEKNGYKRREKIIEQILKYCETDRTSMTDEIMHNPVSNYNDPKKIKC